MEKVDITIIGAGVIGLAIADRLSKAGRNVVLIEKNEKFGMETSSRNSEVIHSGIYYPQGTMKAQLCVKGNKMLYDYCIDHDVKTINTGKIVVAANEFEKKYLKELKLNGTLNGVDGLEILQTNQLKVLEPQIQGIAGLFVPSAGIIDVHGYMYWLLTDAQNNGVMVAFNSEVTAIEKKQSEFLVEVNSEYGLKSKMVINCAGLNSDKIAGMAGIDIDKSGYRIHYCKGNYFKISRSLKVKRLIYPVPPKNIQSLGIHLVLGIGGDIKFGPDAVYVDNIDYNVDENRREPFYQAIKKYLPSIQIDELTPDMAGIRPKLQYDDGPFRDFVISDEKKANIPGLINLIGIDSPGLTSSLSIAEHVEGLVKNIV